MSSKINVLFVMRKHFRYALRRGDTTIDGWSIASFIIIPMAIGAASYFSKNSGTDNSISITITASSVFAGLLLNLLILVYDQRKRLDDKLHELCIKIEAPEKTSSLEELLSAKPKKIDSRISKYELHKSVLTELVSNISYSIIISLTIILFCVASLLTNSCTIELHIFTLDISKLFFSTSMFFSANLIVTILMIVKRVFRLIEDT